MSPRLPFLLLIALAVGGIAVSRVHGERPTLEAATLAEASSSLRPTVAQDQAASSTWYCAAGSVVVDSNDLAIGLQRVAAPKSHSVVVANTTDAPVDAMLTAYSGELAAPPDVPTGEAADASSSTSSTGSSSSSTTSTTSTTTPSTTTQPQPVERTFRLAPHGQATFRLDELMDSSPVTAAVVEANRGGVVVEQFLSGVHGNDVAPCSSLTSTEWHFAWGKTTRDARELLVLFNPFPSDATIDGTFSSEDGTREPVRWQGLTVPARSVVAVDVGDDVTRRELLAASIRSRNGGLLATRVQVLDGSADAGGLSVTLGQPVPSPTWSFVTGPQADSTGERVVLYNPGRDDADVAVTVTGVSTPASLAPDAPIVAPAPFELSVRAGRFEVIDLASADRLDHTKPHGIVVRSSNGDPIVAERVLSFRSSQPGAVDLAAGVGSAAPSKRWAMPVVSAGGGATTTYLVSNADPLRPVRVWLAIHAGTHGRLVPQELQAVEIPPAGQVAMELPATALPIPTDAVTATLDASGPVVVERSLATDGVPRSVGLGIPFG